MEPAGGSGAESARMTAEMADIARDSARLIVSAVASMESSRRFLARFEERHG